MKRFEVILNAQALNLASDTPTQRFVEAARFEHDGNTSRVVFYDANDKQVAMFMHALAISEVSGG